MRISLRSLIASVSVLPIFFSQGLVATAEEEAPSSSQELRIETGKDKEITPEVVIQAFTELNNSNTPRRVNDDGTVSFNLNGLTLTLPNPNAAVPYVSGGKESGGFWVEFTPLEQDMIISGSGFALGAAICGIPGVGWAACTVVGAIITGATVVLSHHKKCDGRLKIHYGWAGDVRSSECT